MRETRIDRASSAKKAKSSHGTNMLVPPEKQPWNGEVKENGKRSDQQTAKRGKDGSSTVEGGATEQKTPQKKTRTGTVNPPKELHR